VQAALLRALQDGEIQRVGAPRPEKMDVRIIASTNRDLLQEAHAGRFREDLYYRLAVVELVVPPLRERRSDIPALAQEFTRRYQDKFALERLTLSPGLVERLAAADWPGNVRQLENTIARLAALSAGGVLEREAFGPRAVGAPPAAVDAGTPELGPSLREQVEAFERNLIKRALEGSGGNRRPTAAAACSTSPSVTLAGLVAVRLAASMASARPVIAVRSTRMPSPTFPPPIALPAPRSTRGRRCSAAHRSRVTRSAVSRGSATAAGRMR
jgi:DNA-binding NtrC family response regulator